MVYIIFGDVRVLMNTNQHYIKRMQSQAPFLLEEMFFFSFLFLLCWETASQLEETLKCKHKKTKNTTEIQS